MDQLKGKVVVITGGSSGIGLAIVKRLLNADVKFIAMFELDSPDARKVVEDLEKENEAKIVIYPCDVTNTSQLEANFDSVFREHGTVDILINNAGVATENAPEQMIDVNYKAVILGSLMMIERVLKHNGGKGGTIVNVSSVLGIRNEGFPVYGSTKNAVVSFTQTMKQHFHLTGIKVVAICPGLTDTPLLAGIRCPDFIEVEGAEVLMHHKLQSPDHVAAAVMKLMIQGNCGDVWVSENEEPPYSVVTRVEVLKNHL